jgi:hypothetical protein
MWAVWEDMSLAEPQIGGLTETRLLASDGAEEDAFGYSVSISGDTAVIGALGDDENGANTGSVYIFERNEGGIGNWGEVTKLTASDAEANDRFGGSVAISGDTVVVGASWKDGAGTARGAVYVFERNEGGEDNWGEVTKLTASDAMDYDRFGQSVAIDKDTIAVGGDLYLVRANQEGEDRGAVYVFERNEGGEGNWGEVTKLTASDAADGDFFGQSVAIDGDIIVVGAPWKDDTGRNRGAVYVFERNEGGEGNWGEATKLTASDAMDNDMFGQSVDIRGDTIVVGGDNREDETELWAAYVFERNEGGEGNWGEATKLTASDAMDNDSWIRSVAMSGDILVVGTNYINGQDEFSGSAYVFEWNADGVSNWVEVTKLTASDAEANDRFGGSVAISGDAIVIGAYAKDSEEINSGAAYVYHDTTKRIVFLPLILMDN